MTRDGSLRTFDGVQERNDEATDDVRTDGMVPKPTLTGLTDAEREVFVSVDLEGLSPSELASFTKWEASTIRTILSRARRKRAEDDHDD
ncbi:hypothetical protein QIT48_gp09 [Haloterrigena jeotgali icosahedral virus 1]|uniref:RNA polymerase sigma factor 70 region 4 type 2 domain-containing protein n=2 Tax=root TaxID=1 RepID=A0AAF0T8I7_9EURY|nr:sigma factor-like helix-turn-helix DNA-binding protein [Natrinema thermotolerans]YP_010772647.1 hypothetical protein QIT48_gp09 [Haloterrigena jeotgali icosahedral virus 1]QCC57411.1 hypothetical protein DVR14_01655 [Natrinema thermotolerans]WMT10384.1 hypothetical protein NP511_22740 [Natrinema thermotolerans]WPH65797.1 hypothetical protein HJIV1_gp6 [Haloterrigena jeotgali icosahedral virus 1]DAC85287.1 TPA_asm: hypothetical protein HJIV1gp9 [Haloterrigena jeotgali icosahedral virus 1]